MTDGAAMAVVSAGNTKLGKGPHLGAFSLAPMSTCPGSTEWCRKLCYAGRPGGPFQRYAETNARWTENEAAVRAGKMPRLKPGTKLFRLHVSGDFFSAPYIRAWIRLVQMHPDVRFWGYTRSWRVGRLVKALEQLRDQPNVQLFASVDPLSEMAPDGWRVAFIEGDQRYAEAAATSKDKRGLPCPEQHGTAPSCEACGYCFNPPPRNRRAGFVQFSVH